nr:signal peptidase II [uncultured Oscillibacter sp.]
MFYAILTAALVVVDQIVKYLVRANIELGGSVPFLPCILDLTYVQNTGAAFSMLRSHTWVLTLTSAVVVLAVCALIVKGFFKNRLGLWSAALVLAGGMGNLIDRAVFGFVTDMFKTTFMNFAVFNVADCCITIGVPLLFLYVWLYVGKDEKKDEEQGEPQQAESGEADGE